MYLKAHKRIPTSFRFQISQGFLSFFLSDILGCFFPGQNAGKIIYFGLTIIRFYETI